MYLVQTTQIQDGILPSRMYLAKNDEILDFKSVPNKSSWGPKQERGQRRTTDFLTGKRPTLSHGRTSGYPVALGFPEVQLGFL